MDMFSNLHFLVLAQYAGHRLSWAERVLLRPYKGSELGKIPRHFCQNNTTFHDQWQPILFSIMLPTILKYLFRLDPAGIPPSGSCKGPSGMASPRPEAEVRPKSFYFRLRGKSSPFANFIGACGAWSAAGSPGEEPGPTSKREIRCGQE